MATDEVALAETDNLRNWLNADFGGYADLIYSFCVSPVSGRPLYASHIDVVITSVGGQKISPHDLDSINAAYLYLTCAYYCVDALADGHPQLETNSSVEMTASSLPLFISALAMRVCGIGRGRAPDVATQLMGFAHDALIELKQAMRVEVTCCASKEVEYHQTVEFVHLSGRSSAIIFLFRAVALLAGTVVEEELLQLVRQTLVAIQRGDDIADWRPDLRAGKWTPFLRQCAKYGAVTEEEFEEIILLDGQLEAGLGHAASLLRQVLSSLKTATFDSSALTQFVEYQLGIIQLELRSAVNAKLDSGVRYEAAAV